MLGVTLPVWRGSKLTPMRREAEARLDASRAELDGDAQRDGAHGARGVVDGRAPRARC